MRVRLMLGQMPTGNVEVVLAAIEPPDPDTWEDAVEVAKTGDEIAFSEIVVSIDNVHPGAFFAPRGLSLVTGHLKAG